MEKARLDRVLRCVYEEDIPRLDNFLFYEISWCSQLVSTILEFGSLFFVVSYAVFV